MPTIYHIDITNGVIKYDYAPAPRVANEYHAPNAKQYFAARNMAKPEPVAVIGWPFDRVYLTHGSMENGQAVAWSPNA
jgi:hypothetical protein